MTFTEIIDWCRKQAKEYRYVRFPEAFFAELTEEGANLLAAELSSDTLMLLPAKEIRFFQWLKQADPAVWKDLWGGDELQTEPYVVAMSFLPLLLGRTRGFPICDLRNSDNYYFTLEHIIGPESRIMVESAKVLFMDNKPMTTAQLLALEISLDPIDIWRFAYNHQIDIKEAKAAVESLVEDNVLIHLTDAEHISAFLRF